MKTLGIAIAILGLPLLLLVSSSACKSSDEASRQPLFLPVDGTASPAPPAPAPKTVALVLVTNANPFFVVMERGARRAEREFGIQLRVVNSASYISGDLQSASVRQVMQDKVDAIVLVPGHSVELVSVVKEARNAGIVVINLDNRLDSEALQKMGVTDVPFIGVDNEEGAYLSAKYLGSKLTGTKQVAIIGGDPLAPRAGQDREKGALQAFAEIPGVEVVATEAANWKIEQAYQVTARMFERHPKLEGIFCANDLMALGAIRYLEETKKEHVLVTGYDGIEEALMAIRGGHLIATVDQHAEEQGYMGVKYAVRALAGEKLPAETFFDVELVTVETLLWEDQ